MTDRTYRTDDGVVLLQVHKRVRSCAPPEYYHQGWASGHQVCRQPRKSRRRNRRRYPLHRFKAFRGAGLHECRAI